MAAALARTADVVAFDLRGHGRSGGRNTVGDRELLDVDAAVAWARAAGYARVATAGFSLGAAVALRQAALGGHRPDAVVAVSGPARWYSRESAPMRAVHWVLEQPHGRLIGRLLGVRLDRPWAVGAAVPGGGGRRDRAHPAAAGALRRADPYFSAAHPGRWPPRRAGTRELWTEPGSGHGETGTDAALAGRIAGWAVAAGGSAARPTDRAEPRSTVDGGDPADRRAPSSEVG